MSFIINPYAFSSVPVINTPSDLADIWEWWEPSREGGLSDNDLMATLNGQANNRDWTQSTEANKPTYKTNQINSLAAVRFGGSPVMFDGPDMSALTAGHVFLIIKVDNDPALASATSGLWKIGTDGSGNGNDHYPDISSGVKNGFGSDTRKDCGNPAQSLTVWHVVEFISTSSEFTARWNGGTPGSGNHFTTASNTVAFLSAPTLGKSLSTPYLVGYIAGMYLCSAKLSDTNRSSLINYINSRFALSSA